jgi:eukaryotic-like serine/threonine-protein kinase
MRLGQSLYNAGPKRLGQSLYYQLTHDYLVPSLREWLTRKQRETKKGRAELKLAERAATWAAKPENKQLPTLWEWFTIRRLTEKAKWKPGQRQLMVRANRYHLTRAGLVSALCVMLLLGGFALKRWNDARQLDRDATNLVASLQTADFAKIPEMIERLDEMREVVDPKLRQALEEHDPQSDERLKLSLGLLASDSALVDYLLQRMLKAPASQVPLLINQLAPHSKTILPQLWTAAQQHDPKTLLQSASALASYDTDGEQWQSIASKVADLVVQENPLRIAVWIDALRPAGKSLNPELKLIYASPAESRSQTEIDLATEILDSYAAEDFQLLHELILVGGPKQFSKLFDKYTRFRQQALDALRGELARPFDPEESSVGDNALLNNASDDDAEARRLAFIQRQANAAVALVRLEDPTPVYQFLTVDRDPEALSQFIYRIRGREVSPSLLIKSFQELQAKAVPDDATARKQHYYRLYGFLLGLGEYSLDQLPARQRDTFAGQLAELYGSHPSRAVHSALGWLLRRWGQDEAVRRVDETPLDYDESGVREWYVLKIDPPAADYQKDLAEMMRPKIQAFAEAIKLKNLEKLIESSPQKSAKFDKPPQSTVIDFSAPIYFKMIVFPGGEFDMGELGRTRRVQIAGPIAVSDREVTWRQFSPVDGDTHRQSWERQYKKIVRADDPAFAVNWFEAVRYCRWLTSAMGLDEQYQSYEKIEFPEGATSEPGWVNLPDNTEWPMRLDRLGFRLPTEAEWEYVARAGTETQYSFSESDSLLSEYCWYQSNSDGWYHPTGQLRPSVGGLFDIHGNLWEWVDDWYTRGSARMNRGGGWLGRAADCRSADRGGGTPRSRGDSLGFRVVLVPVTEVEFQTRAGAGGP